jgi:hypothetical protein
MARPEHRRTRHARRKKSTGSAIAARFLADRGRDSAHASVGSRKK